MDSQLPPGQPEESTVTSASAAAFASRGKEMEEKGKEAEDGEAEDHEKDSSTTPSLGSYQPMPGPWGRLQQVGATLVCCIHDISLFCDGFDFFYISGTSEKYFAVYEYAYDFLSENQVLPVYCVNC